jgi:hypothetical protein
MHTVASMGDPSRSSGDQVVPMDMQNLVVKPVERPGWQGS